MPLVTAQRLIKVAPFAGKPIGKFEGSMPNCDQPALVALCYGSMAGIMNLAAA